MKIILAHGILGFGTIDVAGDPISYFKGVKAELEKHGHQVIAPPVAPVGPVTERAPKLAEAIKHFANRGDAACILAHSMGGLDARHAISHDDEVAARVRTLVTIGTPHFGSPVADAFSAAHALHALFGLETHLLQELEGTTSLFDLTTDAGDRFEHENKNREGIDYRTIAGIGRSGGRPTSRAFLGTYAFLAARGLESDGMVPKTSAARHAEKPWDTWPCDHADEIGWDLDHPHAEPSAEHLQRYVHLLERVLRERAAH